MFWIYYSIGICALCAFLAGIMIPKILLISFRRNLFDEPDERKIHTSTVPRLGGMAFVPVVFFSMSFMLGLASYMGYDDLISLMHMNIRSVTFAFCPLLMLYIVGMADDLIGIRYRAKFIIQIICAVILLLGGYGIYNFHGFLGVEEVPTIIVLITSIGLSVFITNAINLIDGIDGLASGLSLVALLSYGLVFLFVGEYFYSIMAAGTFGVLLPFFYYNVFGDPKKHRKIFMGDTGSLTIGMMLCILSFKIMNLDSSPSNVNLLVIAMSPLVIPCFDVIRVFIARVRHHKSPFLPDKTHIHHRLLSIGLSQRLAMITIVCSSVLFTVFNTVVSMWINVNLIIIIDFIVFYFTLKIAMYIWSPWGKELRANRNKKN